MLDLRENRARSGAYRTSGQVCLRVALFVALRSAITSYKRNRLHRRTSTMCCLCPCNGGSACRALNSGAMADPSTKPRERLLISRLEEDFERSLLPSYL